MSIQVEFDEKGENAIITIPVDKDPELSSSGKTFGVCNSRGFQTPEMIYKNIPAKWRKKRWRLNVYLGFANK